MRAGLENSSAAKKYKLNGMVRITGKQNKALPKEVV
jgi:hypothetical protein